MLSQSTALFCHARKLSSISTALYVRFSSSQFCKAFSALKARYICRVPHAGSFNEFRKGFFLYRLSSPSYRAMNTGRYHRKERFTSCIEKETILSDESAKISASRKSLVKLRSAVAEYILDEDGFMNIEDLVDFLKRESAMDICVIKASGYRRSYVEYFVIVSGVSTRHLRAMAKNLEQLVGRHRVLIEVGGRVLVKKCEETRALRRLERVSCSLCTCQNN